MLVIIQCHYNVMNKLAKHKKDSTKIREERKWIREVRKTTAIYEKP